MLSLSDLLLCSVHFLCSSFFKMAPALNQHSVNTFTVLTLIRRGTVWKSSYAMPTLYATLSAGKVGMRRKGSDSIGINRYNSRV